MTPLDMVFGKLHQTNSFGEIKIIKYTTSFDVDIEFIKTSSRANTTAAMIRKGAVRDKFSPSVCGFGYVGVGKHSPRENGKDSAAYVAWHDMIVRCYSQKKLMNSPTYINCTVCDEWRNFQSFAEWFSKNHIKGFQLDKDIKVSGNKIYKPDACCFVSPAENISTARAKSYSVKSPSGDVVSVYNMREFCRGNNLNPSYMASVCKGNKKSHKGWTSSSKT
tara:strand:- start:22 stop:681 length:660 start_codon:yes stop_codon:yes gene_type:complete